jgi:preprotein translocase subunit SecB
MPKPDNLKSFKMDPEQYGKLLAGVDFNKITLTKLEYEINSLAFVEPVVIHFTRKVTLKEQKDAIFSVDVFFEFEGKTETTQIKILSVSGNYLLDFSTKSPVNQDFIEIFTETSLGNLIWPYLRELFTNLTYRANIPPVFLPLLKFIPPSSDEASSKKSEKKTNVINEK